MPFQSLLRPKKSTRFVSRKEGKINIRENDSQWRSRGHCRGSLSVVGIGPGAIEHLSQKVYRAIAPCKVIVGYYNYIKLLGDQVKGKEVIASGMSQELRRASFAIQKAWRERRFV